MAEVIGPRFPEELQAAGLIGLPFTWDTAGHFTWGPTVSEADKAAVLAVLAAHDPTALATDRDDVRDAYIAAKQAVQVLAADAGVPAVARQAVVKLGLCLEALLLYLNKRIA